MVKFFPRPVVVGFTNGIAILIASTQIRDFFGLRMEHVPGDFFHRMGAIAQNFYTLNWAATAIGIGSLLVMIICLRFFKRIPGAIVVCVGTIAGVSFFDIPAETIGTRFGGILSGLPHIAVPKLQPLLLLHLLSPAITVAMLGAIESLFSAVVSDKMSNDKHNPNVELVAQGVANIFSPLFEIPEILKLSKTDIAVWVLTLGLTVFADLTVAVEVGMILAAFSFIRKISVTTTISKVTEDYIEDGRVHILQDKEIPPYVAVYRIHAPFLFGVTDKVEAITESLKELPPIVIVRLRNMTAIDAMGIAALEDLADRLKTSGRAMLVCGARPQPAALMNEAGFDRHVGAENICENITEALKRADEIHKEGSAALPSIDLAHT
jgi:MFS superfamily sulfate permease-like transporter